MTSLARTGARSSDLDALRARVAEQDALLTERAEAAERLNRELVLFAARYKHDVGTLHEQLDRLELDIAEAELGFLSTELAAQQERSPASASPLAIVLETPPAPRYTSDAIRKLFRDVARAIHPDLARDAQARDRRHALMVAANKAYAIGDEDQLRRILEGWERSPEHVQGDDDAAVRERLERRMAQIEADMELCARHLSALQESPLHELKLKVGDAAAQGRDLVGDLVRRLKRDILAATNRLEAMRYTP